MQVKLILAEDRELKKEVIRRLKQIVNDIVKEEFVAIINENIDIRTKRFFSSNDIGELIRSRIDEAIQKVFDGHNWDRQNFRKIVEERVDKALGEIVAKKFGI